MFRLPCFNTPARHFRCASSRLTVLLCAALALTSGCATFNKIAPYPKGQPPVDLAIGKRPLSKMNDLPLGAYYDEAHGIVVTGYQKGVRVGMLFGVVGVLVANSANKSTGTARYSENAAHMGTDLAALTKDVLTQKLASGACPAVKALSETGQLEVTPFALFSVQKDGKARLHAMLRVELRNKPQTDPQWSVRYFAKAPGEYSIEGADNWTVEDRYAKGMKTAIERAVAVMLDDLQGKLVEKRKVEAKGIYPAFNTEFEFPIIVVDENEKEIVGRIAIGDVMIMGGTHVLDRSDFTIKDADFKTP